MVRTPRPLRLAAACIAALALGATGCVAASAPPTKVDAYKNQLDRFPVVGAVSFKNDYGSSRGGGSRSHQGVDIMANRGQRVVAPESGTITTAKWSSSCGYSLGISGDDGIYYLYCHLNNFASGISKGSRVWAGKQVGKVGSSGNASYAYPHLHFEMHPGGAGRASMNPYYRLRNAADARVGLVSSPPKGWR
ncbi:MAG: M23 family metallopeptidase [Microthrixaceae bacterium]